MLERFSEFTRLCPLFRMMMMTIAVASGTSTATFVTMVMMAAVSGKVISSLMNVMAMT